MRTALALLLALVPAACGGSRELPAARATRVEIGPERTTIGIEGVVLEIAPDVRCRLNQVISAGSGGGLDLAAMTFDGHPLGLHSGGLRSGHLFIGETDLGAVAAGARVEVSRAQGVVVDGEPRGAVPAPLESPR